MIVTIKEEPMHLSNLIQVLNDRYAGKIQTDKLVEEVNLFIHNYVLRYCEQNNLPDFVIQDLLKLFSNIEV